MLGRAILIFLALVAILPFAPAQAQGERSDKIQVATVTRSPFSMVENGSDTGFSIELWQALMRDMGRETEVRRTDTFAEMLDLVRAGEVDAAIANISITAEREVAMDFSHPIFDGGLQLMVHADTRTGNSLLSALLSIELVIAIAAAFGLLFVVGMLMWAFERGRQPYFDLPVHKAIFPSFWWALNLLVNGGFEERQPRSPAGRVLAVILVVASLFLVSAFVARITASMTVDAIENAVNSVDDLYGRRVGTTANSTSAAYLDRRELRYVGYDDLAVLLADFEVGQLDAVVFDAPILAHYASRAGADKAQLVGSVFLPENYGIALPSGSALAEPLNQSLLKLRESGEFDAIRRRWFGSGNR